MALATRGFVSREDSEEFGKVTPVAHLASIVLLLQRSPVFAFTVGRSAPYMHVCDVWSVVQVKYFNENSKLKR